jgi:hypothetical protein
MDSAQITLDNVHFTRYNACNEHSTWISQSQQIRYN